MGKIVVNILRANVLASIFIVLVLVMGAIFKKRYSSKWRYMMWLIVGVFLLCPIPLFSGYAPIQIEIMQNTPENAISEIVGVESGVVKDNDISQAAISEKTMEMKENQGGVLHNADKRLIPAFDIEGMSRVFMQIWLAGIILVGIYRVFAYFISRKQLMRWAVPEEDEDSLFRYQWICQKYDVRKQPRLMRSKRLQSPVLVGLKDVYLFVPEEKYYNAELNLIFHHELTHYMKRDLWYKTFLVTVNTIYWFNPFLYLVRYEAQKDIEYLCDHTVVENRPKEDCIIYSKLLVRTASRKGYTGCASASLNDGTATLKERIVYIMKKSRLKYGIFPAVLCVAVLMVSNVLVGCSVKSNETSDSQKVESEEKVSVSNDDTKKKIDAIDKELEDLNKKADDLRTQDDDSDKQKQIEALEQEKENLIKKKEQLEQVVVSKMPVYDGDYAQDLAYSGDYVGDYKIIRIYNSTSTSFEFAIYENENGKDNLIFKRHKAVYTGDGSTAVYKGEKYTLKFQLIEDQGTPGAIIELRVTGFEPVEGLIFMNNDIPGHEFS